MRGNAVRTRLVMAAIVALTAALGIAACGGSSSSSTGSESTSSGSETSAESTTASSESGPADPDKVYAPGVPTLNELYEKGEENPPSSGPPPVKGLNVVFMSCGQEAPACAKVPDTMAAPAKKLGWSYRIINGKLGQNNGWVNGVREAVALQPDVIVVHGVNCPEIQQPLKEAEEAEIPVLGLENIDCNGKNAGGSEELFKVPFIYTKTQKDGTEHYYQWGVAQADYVIDATKGNAKIIQTVYEPVLGQDQKEGQDAELAKCSGCEVVAELPFVAAEETPQGPFYQKALTLLTQYPEANVFLHNFDTGLVTAGLAKGIVDAGRSDDMLVIGGEGNAELAQLIREDKGVDAAPGAHDSEWLAWAAADEINRYFNDEPAVPEGLGYITVDKEHNLPPAGKGYETKIPFEEIYEKSWGLR